MNSGQTIFAQLMDFLPKHQFRRCVERYGGNHRIRSFACLDQFLCMAYHHAAEHLYDASRAALGRDAPEASALAEQLEDHLWDSQCDELIAILTEHAERLGSPQSSDGPDHPRRVLANNVGYFQNHRHHMDYPRYRAKGWPIGSGLAESAVKLFNKRVKGAEQFWSVSGVESILSL